MAIPININKVGIVNTLDPYPTINVNDEKVGYLLTQIILKLNELTKQVNALTKLLENSTLEVSQTKKDKN